MSEKEKTVMKNVAEAMKTMTESEKERLVSYTEGMAFMAKKTETEKTEGL